MVCRGDRAKVATDGWVVLCGAIVGRPGSTATERCTSPSSSACCRSDVVDRHSQHVYQLLCWCAPLRLWWRAGVGGSDVGQSLRGRAERGWRGRRWPQDPFLEKCGGDRKATAVSRQPAATGWVLLPELGRWVRWWAWVRNRNRCAITGRRCAVSPGTSCSAGGGSWPTPRGWRILPTAPGGRRRDRRPHPGGSPG